MKNNRKEFKCFYKSISNPKKKIIGLEAYYINQNLIECPIPDQFDEGKKIQIGISYNNGYSIFFAKQYFSFYEVFNAYPLSGPSFKSYYSLIFY